MLCLKPSRFSLEKVGDPKHRINYAWPKREYYCQLSWRISLKQYLTQHPASPVGHVTVSISHVTQPVSPVGHVTVGRIHVTHGLSQESCDTQPVSPVGHVIVSWNHVTHSLYLL